MCIWSIPEDRPTLVTLAFLKTLGPLFLPVIAFNMLNSVNEIIIFCYAPIDFFMWLLQLEVGEIVTKTVYSVFLSVFYTWM